MIFHNEGKIKAAKIIFSRSANQNGRKPFSTAVTIPIPVKPDVVWKK